MPLTDAERERCRYHMGYPNVSAASSLAFGIPLAIQPQFLLENAFDKVREESIPRVRELLQVLDSIESQLIRAQKYLAAAAIGELLLRPSIAGQTHTDLLEREYRRWSSRLADLLGVPLYKYSTRFGNSGPGNIPVRG